MKPYEQKNFLHNFHVCNSWYLFKLQALTLEHVRHMSLDLVAISSSFNVLVLSGHCHRFRAYLILKVFQVMSIVIQGNFLFFFFMWLSLSLKVYDHYYFAQDTKKWISSHTYISGLCQFLSLDSSPISISSSPPFSLANIPHPTVPVPIFLFLLHTPSQPPISQSDFHF